MRSVIQIEKWKLAGICLMIGALAISGCGSGETVASVSGKVTAAGKPVSGGTLIFAPAGDTKNPGTPAVVQVKEDGTFESRSVIVGKNTIVYNAPLAVFPADYQPKPNEAPAPSPFAGLLPDPSEVDVKSDTTLEIKLGRKK